MSFREPDQNFPARKRLPHDVPSWIPEGSTCFVTINCQPRGKNQLAAEPCASKVLESIRHQVRAGKWQFDLLLFMPDHLHALMSCCAGTGMKKSVTDWKTFTCRTLDISWQRDFFEHRIRNGRSYTEKWDYIINNPLRAALVADPRDWPFIWTSQDFRDGW